MNQNTPPFVSICVLVYNHASYLRECFEGFVMQKTDFAFEVLVHDDASTDNSAEIIHEYTEKYPQIFKPIYQTENQYSKGVDIWALYLFPNVRGKYIALCDGDDYWTDPLKLQKQVDFLEANPEYVMCSHRFKIFDQTTKQMDDDGYGEIFIPITYDLDSFIHGEWYNSPLTVVFRKECLFLEEYKKYSYSKDATLFFHLLKKGKGHLIPEFMAVYRMHMGGIWSGASIKARVSADCKNRLGIYDVERSFESAFFLRSLFVKYWIPRSWLIQNLRLSLRALYVMYKHLGLIYTCKVILLKVLLHKTIA